MREDPPNDHRINSAGRFSSDNTCGFNGAFSIPIPGRGHKVFANCIVSSGYIPPSQAHKYEPLTPDLIGWEHVSVHIMEFGKQRIPTWEEMCFVKDVFWGEDELVIQYHPPKKDYVNTTPFVLHLWKPPTPVPTPPKILV